MFGVGSIPWSPLGRGMLTRTARDATFRGKTDRYSSTYDIPFLDALTSRYEVLSTYMRHGVLTIYLRIDELAKKKGVSMAQISLAWILSKPGVTAPIVGTTKLDNLDEIVSAVDIKLTEEEIAYLEAAYKPQKISGHA